ncbi:NADH:flavin oxidoreductase [Salinactinospora qingdaonensis]|uniref:NADH:flavin oxidoreductase n=1 Tax=Salinactinospora qingdaonensis TaxID=702744 RepID=A0ABP7FT81_9ACTN
MTLASHPALAPAALGTVPLRNRLAVAPMTRVSATRTGVPTERMADYYERFAQGRFGLVITEGTYTDTDYSQGYINQPGLVSADHVAGWRPIVSRVRDWGSRIVAQLMHAGALSQGNEYRDETAGPSPVTPQGEKMAEYGGSGPWPTPRQLRPAEIDDVVNGFVTAARNAHDAGFDGVEIHAANGYLLDQFLTDYTNRRTDAYGGPIANRVRLTAEVVAAVRAALPSSFLVGVRLSQTKVNDFVYRWPGGARDAEIIFDALVAAGAAYLHVASEGRAWIETARLDSGETITALARRRGGVPVIANGGMHDVEQAATVVAEGHADILSVGRGALANPDLPCRIAAGEPLAKFDPTILEPMATLENAARWERESATEGRH